jgi:hypothetical protein
MQISMRLESSGPARSGPLVGEGGFRAVKARLNPKPLYREQLNRREIDQNALDKQRAVYRVSDMHL